MQTSTIKLILHYCRQMCITCLLLGATFVAQAESFDAGVFEFQKKLADNGNPHAQFKLGNMYETGRGVAMDLNTATQWYEKSAASSFKPAQNRLIYLQVKRNGFKSEHKSWLSELTADANAGDGEASMMLGEMNEQGIGMPKNLSQAQIEYKRATVKAIAGSEGAYYAVTDLINKQKIQAQQEEEKRAIAERARKEEADQAARKKAMLEHEQLKQTQLKVEADQRKQDEERQRIDAQKRQLEQQREQSAAQYKQKQAEAVSKSAGETTAPAETFESDLCTGKAASFRTQCR
jgi:uncharacterized protein